MILDLGSRNGSKVFRESVQLTWNKNFWEVNRNEEEKETYGYLDEHFAKEDLPRSCKIFRETCYEDCCDN